MEFVYSMPAWEQLDVKVVGPTMLNDKHAPESSSSPLFLMRWNYIRP